MACSLFLAAGLSCESLLMDFAAYNEFERLHTALCTGEGIKYLRIEQERIPLPRAIEELRKLGWPA